MPDLENIEAMKVYADHLQERHDPRGELIALQCISKPTAETQLRINALIHDHFWDWTGQLCGLVSSKSLVWFRGFPTEGTLRKSLARQAIPPELSTFTRLTGDAPFWLLQSPYANNLRKLEKTDLRVAASIQLPRLESLDTFFPDSATRSDATFLVLLKTLLNGPMPLNRLNLTRINGLHPGFLYPFLSSPVMSRLAHLGLFGVSQHADLYPFLMKLPDNVNLKTATFEPYNSHTFLKFSHRQGYWDRLEISLTSINTGIEQFLSKFLGQLPEDALTSLIVGTSTIYGMGRMKKPDVRTYVKHQRHLDELIIEEN